MEARFFRVPLRRRCNPGKTCAAMARCKSFKSSGLSVVRTKSACVENKLQKKDKNSKEIKQQRDLVDAASCERVGCFGG